jgi:PST family polysaccharide transporter
MVSALIQKAQLENDHADSAFWFLCVSSVLLMSVSIIGSGWWAEMNHQPRVGSVLGVLSMRIPICALSMVQKAVMTRRLEFKAMTFLSGTAEGFGGLVGIGMAVGGAGIWALVGQQLAKDVTSLILWWKQSSWRPRMRFSPSHIRELLSFSISAFVGELGSFAQSQADTLVVGLFFGPTAVGVYRLADRIRGTVLLLAAKLKNAYLYLLRISFTATAAIMASVAVSSDLVVGVLGVKWNCAVNAISILCVMGIFEGMSLLTNPLLLSCSRPLAVAGLVWSFGILNAVSSSACGIALTSAGVSLQASGMALCKLGVFGIAFLPVNMLMAKRASGATFGELARSCSTGLAAACASFSVIWIFKHWFLWNGCGPAVALGLALSIGLCVGAGMVLCLECEWRKQLVRSLRSTAFVMCARAFYSRVRMVWNELRRMTVRETGAGERTNDRKDSAVNPMPYLIMQQLKETTSFLEVKGERIYCTCHSCPEPKGLVLLAGPFTSERPFSYAPWVRWARYLAAGGFVVVRFDYRGVGESTGSFEKMNFRTWSEDIQVVAKWARTEFPAGPLILHGLGLGALLAADRFEKGLGDGLLLWAAPNSGEVVLREGLMRRLSIEYVLQAKGTRKTYDNYVADLKAGILLQVEGYPWSRFLWDDAGNFRLPAEYLPGTEGVHENGRAWKHVMLDKPHIPLVSGLGQWQAINPRAEVKVFPLNPDLTGFFAGNVDWMCTALGKRPANPVWRGF